METTISSGAPYVAFLVGVAARIFVPYILAYLNEHQPFDWKFATGQLVGALVGLVTLWAADMTGAIEAIGALSWIGALAYGWMLADVGRKGQKAREPKPTIDMAEIYRQMDKFSDDETRAICLILDVDYDDLPGSGQSAKARELILHLNRTGRLAALAEIVKGRT